MELAAEHACKHLVSRLLHTVTLRLGESVFKADVELVAGHPLLGLPAKLSPAAAVGCLCAAQILFWTLAPTLANNALPLDVVQNGAWGPEWLISSYENPALTSWCLELSRLVSGTSGWPAYLVSQLFVASTFMLVFLIGREPLGAERALAGTLLLTSIYFFSWRTPEFNHDIAQMPLWAGIALALWRATETNRLLWWILLSLFAAASLYAKLSSSVMLIAAVGWILLEPQARRRIVSPGPWLALALFLAAIFPLAHWLINNGFAPASYAISRGNQSHSYSGTGFLLAQAEAAAPVLLMLGFAGLLPVTLKRTLVELSRTDTERRFGWYLAFLTLAPILISIVMTAAAGTGMRRMWGVPMLNLVGLLAIWLTSARFTERALKRIGTAAAALLLILPAARAADTMLSPLLLGHVKRENWPQAQIATRMRELWTLSTGQPLRIVAGDRTNWLPGLIALACCEEPPSLFTNAESARSPWITEERLAREGALVVWQERPPRGRRQPPRSRDRAPGNQLNQLIGNQPRGIERFAIPGAPGVAPIEVHYAIVPPRIGW